VSALAAGDPVRLDLARGQVEQIRNGPGYPIADVRWKAGARSAVPVSWLTPIGEADWALTERAWRDRGEALRGREAPPGSRATGPDVNGRETAQGGRKRRRRKLSRAVETALHAPFPPAEKGRQLRLGEGGE
jgi:hypothetical protein